MVFSSLLFLFRFLPAVLILYFIVPKKFRNTVLFFTSLIFYAWGEPKYVFLMLFSITINYVSGLVIHKFQTEGRDRHAKQFLIGAVVVNLLLLGIFKYTDFILGSINALGPDIPLLNLALPIGISFYTFQAMSYTIDVYRHDAEVERNFISFGAYVTLFPQLIAGPIVQFKTIAKQLKTRRETVDEFACGLNVFMVGLGKKVLLANNVGVLWDTISGMSIGELPVLTAWIGILAYTFQIYFDFSGYSDMAIGLGHMFGFRFLKNFDHPYSSRSITEFWRRWHISLGTWFRDYVYIPLGGNRCGRLKQFRNIAIVWLLTGIWHGANWNFLMWGAYFGILLMIEKLFLLKYLKKMPAFFSWLYTILLVIISWVIFAFDQSGNIIPYLKSMFGLNGNLLFDSESIYLLYNNAILFLVLILASSRLPGKIGARLISWLDARGGQKTVLADVIGQLPEDGDFIVPEAPKVTPSVKSRLCTAASFLLCNAFYILVFILSIAYLVDATYNPFLYFRF